MNSLLRQHKRRRLRALAATPAETDGCMTGGEFGIAKSPPALPSREHARRVDGSLEVLSSESSARSVRRVARLTAAVLAGFAVLLIGSTFAQARPLPDSFIRLLRVGRDGSIDRGEKQELRQRGLDKIAIAQAVTQAKDGGRITRPEADKIIKAFVVRRRTRTSPTR